MVNLQCESALYEAGHWSKEIAVARDFHSRYPDPHSFLVDEAEFLRSHPEARAFSPHELWIARLEDEVNRRRAMQSEVAALESANAAARSANDETRERKKQFLDTMRSIFQQMQPLDERYFGSGASASSAAASPASLTTTASAGAASSLSAAAASPHR